MAIKASDLTGLQRAIERALVKERGDVPEPPKIMWLARTSSLAIKPIRNRDPVAFKKCIDMVQAMNPTLTIYIFEIEGL